MSTGFFRHPNFRREMVKSQCLLPLLALPFRLPLMVKVSPKNFHGPCCLEFAALVPGHTSIPHPESSMIIASSSGVYSSFTQSPFLHWSPFMEGKQYTKAHPNSKKPGGNPQPCPTAILHGSLISLILITPLCPPIRTQRNHPRMTRFKQGKVSQFKQHGSRHVIKNDSIRYIYHHRQGYFFFLLKSFLNLYYSIPAF